MLGCTASQVQANMVRRQLQTMSQMEREDPPVLKMMGQSQLVELMAGEFIVANGAALTSDDCLSTESERMRTMTVNMSNLHPTLNNPIRVDLVPGD